MGYTELKGANKDEAQQELKRVLSRQNAVKMIIYDPNLGSVAQAAKTIAAEEPQFKCVVWIKNLDLLTSEQKQNFCKQDKVLCTLSVNNKPARWLDANFAAQDHQLRYAFAVAESLNE